MREGPYRVQLSRKSGWKMPENTVSVARPGKFGNPFVIGELKFFVNDRDPNYKFWVQPLNAAEAVHAFRWLAGQQKFAERIKELRGKNLACWCPLDQPCHADVLLELANREEPPHDR